MSTDFEQDLRARLRATPTPDLNLDLDRVVRRGHQAVTRRAVLRGGAGLGLLAVVGLGGAELLRRPDAMPADPPADWVVVDFERLPDGQGVEHPDEPKVVRIEVNRAAIGSEGGTEASVRYRFSDADGAFDQSWAGTTVPSRGMTWGAGTPSQRHVVGLVADQTETIHFPEAGALTLATRPVPGTDLTAFVVRLDEPVEAQLETVYWVDEDGTVHDGFGAEVPTSRHDVGMQVSVFVDEPAGWWGVDHANGMVTARIAERPDRVVLDDDDMRVVAVRLPRGYGDLEVRGGVGWRTHESEPAEAVLVARGPASTAPRLVWRVGDVEEQLDL